MTSRPPHIPFDRDDTENRQPESGVPPASETEERFRSLVESSPDGILVHRNGNFLYANSVALKMYGAASLEDLQTRTVVDLIHPDDRDAIRARIQLGQAGKEIPLRETRMLSLDGQVKDVETTGSRISFRGEPAVQIIIRDITDRKRKELELRKLTRTMRALSSSSQAMMRASDESSYLKEVCRIVVDDCGYKMVWIGFAEDDEAKTVRPVASAGLEAGYLEALRVTWADSERGRGPTGTAIRTRRPALCRDMLSDPNFAPWRDEALRRGYASSVVLPLIAEGKAIGAINIYSRDPDSFYPDEVNLLSVLAGDLAYGLTAIRLRASHTEIENRYRALVETAPDAIIVYRGSQFLYANSAAVHLYGARSFEELATHKLLDLVDPSDREHSARRVQQAMSGETLVPRATMILRLDGQKIKVEAMAAPIEYQGARAIQAVVRDVTARIKMEEELKQAHDELEQKVVERTAELARSEERLRFIMDNMSEGCMILGFDWTYLYLNDAAAVQGHGERKQLLGRTMVDMYPGVERSAVFQGYKKCMIERVPLRFESPFTFADGTVDWFEFSVDPVPEGIFVLTVDITDRKRAMEELDRRNRELLTFHKISEIVLSPRTLEESYDEIVDEICAATGFPIAGIGILDDARQMILLRGQRRLPGESNRPLLELPVDQSPSGVVIESGKPYILTHLLENTKFRLSGLRRAGAQTFVGYPMKVGQKTIGCLNLIHTDNITVSDQMGRWIQSLANYVAVLTERKRAEEELRVSQEQLRALSLYTQSAIEEERKRIAREIHDELGQELSLLQLELGLLADQLPKSDKATLKKAKSMTGLIDSSIRSVQRISTDLRPTLLDNLGLGAAVEWAVREFHKKTKIRCQVSIDPPEVKLDPARSTAFFRIMQETLTNILRHARATRVTVRLTKGQEVAVMTVRDNGVGIPAEQVNDPGSVGLSGMRERVRPWNGTVVIVGKPSKGTEVTVTVPLQP
jgi:PAS domain S-box-containing protein